jgi:hypothetical protein
MALAKDLMQVGIPDQAAIRLGYQIGSVAGAGTTANDATVLNGAATLIIIGSGAANSGVKLSANSEIGTGYLVNNVTANAIILYPPTGGGFNQGAASWTMPAKSAALAVRNSQNGWFFLPGVTTP